MWTGSTLTEPDWALPVSYWTGPDSDPLRRQPAGGGTRWVIVRNPPPVVTRFAGVSTKRGCRRCRTHVLTRSMST